MFNLHRVWWAAVLVVSISASRAASAAQWEFNGDLDSSTGAVLTAEAAAPAATPDVTFVTATINGNLARVASFSRGTYFRMVHGGSPNGGGSFVNQYALIIDVMFPDRSPSDGWAALWQTNTGNGNDGDWFIDPDGALGLGDYGGSVPDGAWHRLALVSDLAAGTYTSFVDGVQVVQRTGEGVDGRFSLDPEALLFADNDGENAGGLVNSVRFEDRALTATELAALGGPTAAGIGAFFFDDFEAYAADADVLAAGWQVIQASTPAENAQWTITNPGGRRNPPTADGTPSTGKFIVSDSDAADGDNTPGTGMSHDLVTPAFSTLGAAAVWLHADCTAQLNNGGDAVFDIDFSIDGGATWTNALRRVSPGGRSAPPLPDTTNADGFFGRLHVGLPASAANKASVKLRFRHFEPTDDWWIALDDILVDGQSPPAGGNCVVLSTQGFAGGLGAMKAVSLAAAPNAGSETWSTTDKGHRYVPGSASGSSGRGVNRLNQPGPTPDFAILESAADPDPAEDEYLETPVLNCFSFNAVYLHFKSETVMADAATQEVLASIDGGATFPIRIFSYNQAGGADNAGFDDGEDSMYSENVFPVPQAAGQAQVVFAFHYKSPGNQQFWAVDDVEVTGRADVCDPRPCGLRNFAVHFDPAASSVVGTWKLLPGDEGFRVFQGATQVGGDLPASATSFTDPSPPKSGQGIAYTLKPLLGGQVERECPAPALDTFTCPAALAARVDQPGKKVKLAWTPGSNLQATSYQLERNGQTIATLALGEGSYTDTPPLASSTEFSVFEYRLTVIGAAAAQCGPLSARAVVSPGAIFLADDFEGYPDDVALELAGWFRVDEVPNPTTRPGEDATWTVTNPGGRSHPPTFDGQPAAGRFAISDSDFASGDNGDPGSGNSNDLWSPSFSTAGKSTVWLHLDASLQLNNNGVVVVDIDVSTDGGITWKNAFRRVAPQRTAAEPKVSATNVDGFFGRLDVDLSALAGQKPDVKFRIRSFEPSDDWWVAVDNVVVDDVPALAGGAVTVLPLEDFSTGIPVSWTVHSLTGGPATWTTGDPCHRSVEANGGDFAIFDGRGVGRLGTAFAIIDSDCDDDAAPTPEDDFLVTPTLDLTRLKEVYLHYKSEINAGDEALQEVLVSLDGGATFEAEPVFSYNGGGLFDAAEEPFYADRILSVPGAAGKASVAFAFHYRSAGNQTWWAIDDVKVSGNPAAATAPCPITGLTVTAAGDGFDLAWTVNPDPNGDQIPDCACASIEVRNGSGAVLAHLAGGATSAHLSGSCATLVGGSTGQLCVACVGADSTETKTCQDVSCGGLQRPGDCTQDNLLDISDPICLLGFLFLGDPVRLPCGDGTAHDPANLGFLDHNGDQLIDLSDAVSLLAFLFLGGSAPEEGLACKSVAGCESACH